MARMTGSYCAVMCSLINTHTHTELKIVVTEAKKTQIEDAVGSSWAALAAEENPQGRGIGTLLVEAGAGAGRGGGEGQGQGG